MYAAFGILAALRVRERTGRGQQVDAALLDGQVSWLTYNAGSYFATGKSPGPLGSAHPSIVPYQAFRASDSHINVAVGSEAIWRRFCDVIDPQLATDARYATNRDRVTHRQDLVRHLAAIFATKPTAAWMDLLDRAGVPNGPILSIADVFAHPQVRHRRMVVEMDHPTAGRIKQTGVPVKFSDTPGRVRTPPPTLGQHTHAILKEVGLSDQEIEVLREASVV
jgi:formyl-CoA transferase/CoA:oxalate CoA-transferase